MDIDRKKVVALLFLALAAVMLLVSSYLSGRQQAGKPVTISPRDVELLAALSVLVGLSKRRALRSDISRKNKVVVFVIMLLGFVPLLSACFLIGNGGHMYLAFSLLAVGGVFVWLGLRCDSETFFWVVHHGELTALAP